MAHPGAEAADEANRHAVGINVERIAEMRRNNWRSERTAFTNATWVNKRRFVFHRKHVYVYDQVIINGPRSQSQVVRTTKLMAKFEHVVASRAQKARDCCGAKNKTGVSSL